MPSSTQQPKPVETRPGEQSRRLFEDEQALIAPGQQRISLLSELALEHGDGATVTDVDGNTYLDFFAGVTVASLGHAHPRYVAQVEAQLRKIIVGSFATESRQRLLALIARLAPGDLARTQLYSGGAEAVEAAFRLAMSVTGKHEVVGFWGGFHGKTAGVVGLIGDESKHGWGLLTAGPPFGPLRRLLSLSTQDDVSRVRACVRRPRPRQHQAHDQRRRRDHRRADARHGRQRDPARGLSSRRAEHRARDRRRTHRRRDDHRLRTNRPVVRL